ncbi:Formate hydrogenlyase subunit 2 [Minicystis rosea]|nr:Formate hydrogenlyase subunit 2 [Minicystis rosea]
MHDRSEMNPREPAQRTPDGWPAVVFDAPVLRGIDARARREIAEAGRVFSLGEGARVYDAGDEGPSFYVVVTGKIALSAVRRGDDRETEIRTAGPGESFGEEATVGLARRATATAAAPASVAEIPLSVFRRAIARAGKADIVERTERSLSRAATADLLRTLSVTRDLGPRELDVLLDTATLRRVERGEHVYRQGEPARELYLVADGLVQIQVEEDDRLSVRAYLGRGDFFGDVELLHGTARAASAVASGPAVLAAVPLRVFRDIAAAHPDLLPRLRRLAEDQEAAQRSVVGRAAANATQHAFRDLYRLKVARSLLVIDLESCVRCGHCAWACADTYGVARLVRRGDKVVTRTTAADEGAPQHLMLPNSCQHCEHPACMVDCPTGAIGRDPSGEVFIRDALCTGCGACAKACPWDNIQMAPRPNGAPPPPPGAQPHADLAVKCDLCRGYEGPACVTACPTGSIFRLNPSEDIADVREIFQTAPRAGGARGSTANARPGVALGAAIAATGIGIAGATMQARGHVQPARGMGLAAGVIAGIGMVALLAYAIPKRRIRSFLRPREASAAPGKAVSIVRPQLEIHLVIGLLTAGITLLHAPLRGGGGSGAALLSALGLTSLAGALSALGYRLLPARLARIERTAVLPEDFPRAGADLRDRLYREASGKSELIKKILEKILLPYARSPLGPLALLASGRSLREEQAALRTRIDAVLEGRGQERLAGLSELIRIVVEQRALPAQRLLLGALRVWLPIHIVTFGVAMALLVAHVAMVLWRRG